MNFEGINYLKALACCHSAYTLFEFYLNRRQIAQLKKFEKPKGIELIEDIWKITDEEIKKTNQYSIDKM
jgi:hypothetical protein